LSHRLFISTQVEQEPDFIEMELEATEFNACDQQHSSSRQGHRLG
jgi:hypothetical protein